MNDEKSFDLDGMYNRQNRRFYTATRDDANVNVEVHRKRNFSAGVMVWLGSCSQSVTRQVILESETMDSDRCIAEVLLVAIIDGRKMFEHQFIHQ